MGAPSISDLRSALPEPAAALLDAVLAVADRRRLALHLVGGPVRDLLLGRPLAELDLLLEDASGPAALALARAAAPDGARVTGHDRFGTVAVRGEAANLDLAVTRREAYAHDGALPSVEAASIEEDLRRRDFTVNALALPLSAAARARHPALLDLEDGLQDLERRSLRVMHRRSFHDDPTRALRAARLAPRLGFSLSRGSRSALRDALRDGAFARVSGERLRREFVKIFEDPEKGLDPSRALRLLDDWHVLGALEPGLRLDPAAAAPLRRLGRAIAAPQWKRGRWRSWVPGFALWLAPLPADLRRRSLRRLAVRGESAERIAAFPRERDAWLRGLSGARGRGAIDSALRRLDEEQLHALYALAPPPQRRRIARYANEDRGRRAPINGEDLLGIGISGPGVGRALERIRAAYLDGAVRTRDDALALARELSRGRRASRPRRRRPA